MNLLTARARTRTPTRAPLRRLGLLAAATLLCASQAQAYLTFDGPAKWSAATPGATTVITWSVMPEGTGVVRTPDSPPYLFEDFWQGTNNLTSVYNQVAPDAATGQARFMTAPQAAFNTWAGAANIQFVQVADDGSPIGFTGSTAGKVGDIRIGAFDFLTPFDAVAAHTFQPPNGTTPLDAYWASTNQQSDYGDLNLNALAHFSTFEGLTEGDSFGGFPNDLQGLLLHELGHALGLQHPEDDGVTGDEASSVMYVGPGCCNNIHRQLGADDIAGIQSLYGPALAVPEASSSAMLSLGLLVLGLRRRAAARAGC